MLAKASALAAGALSRHPLRQPPPHPALREQSPCARRLLHADALCCVLELPLALVRAEKVTALLVFAARRLRASLHCNSADGITRPALNLLFPRVHLPAPAYPHRN